ncbi:hypothetical protein [Alloyangia pacifica]|uniref:Uncharacterized protein n=1 Tax=Alloyangia pacifica TaxID=311180 RepID=A0A1I6PNS1_9RHOB|nr:hypothetical protein [Alloyangia pacifica]SDG32312.1 hypothetical protein SAMN04488245_102367 [Alloyangia pacifica]SFS41846.1 hypothetical protein SAMN04488050_101668 [Alloyangia pacifica]
MFSRIISPPTIRIGDAEIRLSRRLASQVAFHAIGATQRLASDLRTCEVGVVLATLDEAHGILASVGSVIDQTATIRDELLAVDQLLSRGIHEGAPSTMLTSAETIFCQSTCLRALAPDIDLPDLDALGEQVRALAAALADDLDVARGRLDGKLDEAARQCTAVAASRSDTRRNSRKAKAPIASILAYPHPAALRELVQGVPQYQQPDAAKAYLADQQASIDAAKERRRQTERDHLTRELKESIWA